MMRDVVLVEFEIFLRLAGLFWWFWCPEDGWVVQPMKRSRYVYIELSNYLDTIAIWILQVQLIVFKHFPKRFNKLKDSQHQDGANLPRSTNHRRFNYPHTLSYKASTCWDLSDLGGMVIPTLNEGNPYGYSIYIYIAYRWWFQLFLVIFTPEAWRKWSHFDDHIFQMGWWKTTP